MKIKHVVFFVTYIMFFLVSCNSWPKIIHKHCIKGEVVMKKKLNHQHGIMEITFSNVCDNSFTYLGVENSDKEFWNYLSVGDSLFKESESWLIEVKKQNESRVFKLTDW